MNNQPDELIPAADDGVRKAGYRFNGNTLRNWRCAGVGPRYVKVRGRIFYRRADLDAYIHAGIVETRDAA